MKNTLKIFALAGTAGLLFAGCGTTEAAENTFPDRPLELIVPTEAGGSLDTTARALAAEMEESLGQNIRVLNRSGASYTVGLTEGANATPDGYTLVMTPGSSFTTIPLILDQSFTSEDFEVVGPMMDRSYVLVVSPNGKYQTIDDLANASENYTYSTFGEGNFTHFAMAGFGVDTDTIGEAVPYTNSSNIIQAVQNGQIDVGILEANFAIDYIESGELIPIATTAPERNENLPDVPTMGELGYESAADFTGRTVLSTQDDVPEDVLETLREATMEAYESEAFQEYYQNVYGEAPVDNLYTDFFGVWAKDMSERLENDLENLERGRN